MVSALHRDFKLKSMITLAVFNALMNLSLFHTTMSVPGCTTFVSGDMLRYCHKEIFYTRLDHPSVSAKHSIWNRGSELS